MQLVKNAFNEIKQGTIVPGSSVSIVSDYGLDDRGSIPDRAENFSSSLCVQTGSGGPPSLLSNGYRGSFPVGVKHGRGVTLITHPH
jgi:hypothetical protein